MPVNLTTREVEVLKLIATGKTNNEISADLGISERTTKHHCTQIFRKLGLSGRTGRVKVTLWAIKHGIVAIAILLALGVPAARAQFTAVTGTIADATGIPYAGGTIKAQLSSPGATVTINNQAQCAGGGFGSAPCQVPIQGTVGPLSLSAGGTFSLQLADNTQVQPGGTQWIFTVNISPGIPPPEGTGPQTCTATITISGGSQNISGNVICPGLRAFPASTTFGLDPQPAVPGSLNDEFIGSSLNTSTRWTWVNQGAATATVGNNILFMTAPVNAGTNIRFIYQAAPGTPWQVTAKIALDFPFAAQGNAGLVLADATGKLIFLGMNFAGTNFNLDVLRYTNVTTFSAAAFTGAWAQVNAMTGGWFWLSIKDDGANLTYYFSTDSVNYQPLLVESRTAFLTAGPTRVGLLIDAENSLALSLSCEYFRRTL